MFPFLSTCFFYQLVSLSVSPSVVEQCICHRLQANDMVLEWVAYSSTKNGVKLKMHNLEQFEHDVTTVSFINYSRIQCLWVIILLDTNYSIFFQVLNKKNKSKQSVRREDSQRTRDINSIHELYPSQWCCHSSSAMSFSCIHTSQNCNCISSLDFSKKRIKAEEEEENLLDSYSTPAKVRDLLQCFLLWRRS